MITKLKIFLFFSLLMPLQALAQSTPNTSCPTPSSSSSSTQLFNPLAGIGICNLHQFMSWLVKILSGFIGLFAVIAIVIAGYEMVTQGGNPEKVQEAKQRIFYAITGLIITVLAYSIIQIVLNLIANKV